MFQVRIHGRGGQGVVTAAELLSVAAFDDGQCAQAFPSFGSERTGAPVVSYCRIAQQPIRSREPVLAPDAIVVQDVTLVHQVDLFSGLEPSGYVLLNTSRALEELGLDVLGERVPADHLQTCPASDLALEHVGRALPNAPLLGGLCALTGVVTLGALARALRERFAGPVGERNVLAAEAAYAFVAGRLEGAGRAASA